MDLFTQDESPKLRNMLCFALYAASRAMTDAYRPLLEALGLTYPQYLVMIVLWENEICSVKDLGQLLHLDSGTLSPLLKRLEAVGLIKRQRSTQDERIVNISLTEQGHELRNQALTIPPQIACQHGLTADAYTRLLSQLEELIAALTAASPNRET
ncbi:MAG: MarR family transcriptional regulator [Ktedonobacteraceae bacterium]|nr:MarR family transcriptional regulator [Ktedonobacteraceae bacterium]